MHPEHTTRAVIYTRISKDATHLGAGVRHQEADCRKLIAERGWTLVTVLSDNDTSAFSGARRPGYEALLGMVRAHQVDTVVVWHTDRLYRRGEDLEAYVKACEEAHVSTHAVQSGPLDLATPSGRMVARQLGAMAVYEVEQKSARQIAANQARAAAGQTRLGGTRLFGYTLDMSTTIEAEAKLVREAYERITTTQDASMYGIAKAWNELGIYTPQSRRKLPTDVQAEYDQALARWEDDLERALEARQVPPERPKRPYVPSKWTGSKVRLLLTNPRYAGITTYRREIVRDADGKPVPAQWPAIVDTETWQAAQAVLATKPGWPTGDRQLLAGVAVCGVCGERISGGGTRNGRRRLRCSAHGGHPYRESAPIEDFVVCVVLARLQQPDALEALTPTHDHEDLAALRASLDALAAREQEMATAFAMGALTINQLTAATASLKQQRADIESRMPMPANPVMQELLAADDVEAVWESLDQDHQRAIIRTLCKVEVMPARTKEKAYLDWRKRVLNPESVRITWL